MIHLTAESPPDATWTTAALAFDVDTNHMTLQRHRTGLAGHSGHAIDAADVDFRAGPPSQVTQRKITR